MMSSGEMCSFFYQSMESTVQGDLGDIVRGGGGFLPSLSNDDASSAVDLMGEEFQELISTKTTASPLSLRPIKPATPHGDHSLVSAPRAPGVKRRKGQAKRVICIPAPASSDQESKSSGGVVVPSDLWAWRKYGQKPIKGSPFPRGYYRCSSSKGCSARKQVERSGSDPNMLVITYTSEHNHPWPTHRNSLAGSTRSQPPKSTSKGSNKQALSHSSTKQELLDDHMSLSSSSSPHDQAIKDESLDFDRPPVFDQTYEPMMLDSKDMGFFDELGGLEPDPMSSFFSSRELKLEEDQGVNRANLDPLSYFDWDISN